MAAIDDLIDEYLGVALSPAEMRDLAMLQVKDASVQDDAVQRAVANAQGTEQRQRSALEEYLIGQEEQARAESQKALEMAQHRLNGINQNISLLSSTVGLGKEGKRQLASLEKEKQDIFRAFPTLGEAGEVSGDADGDVFDIKKWIEAKDYSPEAIKRLYDENDREAWDEAIRTGDLKLYNAMNDFKLGALSDDTINKMRYIIRQRPELAKELKLNKEYSGLLDIIPDNTQGDLKKKDSDEKKAAAKAKAKAEEDEKLAQYDDEMKEFAQIKDRKKRARFWDTHPGFKERMKALKAAHKLPAEIADAVRQAFGD